jgi:signal transduction histidine kinase/ActR/RegA family two-component response regulator
MAGIMALDLESVIATPELTRRPPRSPNYEVENRALVSLALHLSTSPQDVLQKLVETTLELCRADSAGLSLVEEENGRLVFRWVAIAGQFAKHVLGTTPRDFSPCGIVLNTNAVQLVARPGKYYTYLDEVSPPIIEALLQPFPIGGRPMGTIWVLAHDERRRFDGEDARALGSLATFAASAYQVISSLRAVREADQRKDEFLALLSHEVRSPLNAVLTWISVLNEDSVDKETRERAHAGIERSAVSLARMIDDLLDVAKITAGKLSIELQDVDLAIIIRNAVDAMLASAKEAGVEVELAMENEVVPIRADSTRIQQIIGNLVSNAIKFTPAGGRISIEARLREGVAEVIVSDTGEGIAADALPVIFERFRQGDASITRRHGGLGLGLAVARHLAHLHGGTIEARSYGPGRGSTFQLRLPSAPCASQRGIQETNGPIPLARNLEGFTVLVVDDDIETRLALETVLEHAGAKVKTASSVPEALQACESEGPDVVITDLAMPEADGYELLRTLRRKRSDYVPVLALTGAATPQERQSVLDAGFTLHLTKPVEPAELLTAVAMAASGAACKFAEERRNTRNP